MLTLNLERAPQAVALPGGAVLHVMPVTTTLIEEVRDELLAGVAGDPEDDDAQAAMADALRIRNWTFAIARRAIAGWDGIGDMDGTPIIEPTEAAIDALMEHHPAFIAFRDRVVVPALKVQDEGNV